MKRINGRSKVIFNVVNGILSKKTGEQTMFLLDGYEVRILGESKNFNFLHNYFIII